jgi:photosystem II stability/assembly factor-like uncharacterized protein
MQLSNFPYRRLIGTAAIACAAALLPAAALAATTTPAATAGAGPAAAVPADFQPASASFYSPAAGVVLGSVGCTPGHACAARLAATTDGGARWRFLTAPDISLSTVSEVVFVNRRDGWLYDQYYGRRLWATHDGGARWSRVALPGDIQTIAASAATVYAVVDRSTIDRLFSSPAGQNAWARVGNITGNLGSALAVSGNAAWFGPRTAGTRTHLWATADGVHWRKYPFACPGAYGLSSIAAASPAQVVFLCTGAGGMYQTAKEVLRSVNGGKTEHLTGYAPVGGDVYGSNGVFAVPPHRASVVTIAVVTPGPDYLDRSANGGKTWAQITVPGTGGGVFVGSLCYVSRTAGFVVAEGLVHQLLRTSDAGIAWHPVSF